MLTEAKARQARPRDKRYTIAAGDGLYLEVRPNGNKSWLLRTTRGGKRSWQSVGKYPLLDIRMAREAALRIQRGEAGLGPSAKKTKTFRAVAEEFSPRLEDTITSDTTLKACYSVLANHIYPIIGDKDIASLTPKSVYACIERLLMQGKLAAAERCMQMCSRVFRYGMYKEYCITDPTIALKGAIPSGTVKHHACLTAPDDIGQLMRTIYKHDTFLPRMALLMSAYSMCRPSEVRCAEWSEFDISKGIWIIPAAKMKKRRDHMVPITRQIRWALEELRPLATGRVLFPNQRDINKPMSAGIQSFALKAMGYETEEMVPHGFRSMASTILNEHGYNRDWIEMQLAHAPRDTIRAVYNRAQYWDERVEMLQWYNDFLDELRDRGA